MCSPFRCGSFKNWKDYDIDELPTPIKTPKRSKSCRSYSCKRRDSKNPYANQGLDKFSALLADLEAKKQKIYTQKDSQDISLIYFTYNNSDELKPFIVKVKKQQHTIIDDDTKNAKDHQDLKRDSIEASASVDETRVQRKKEELISRNFKTHWSLYLKNARHIFGYFSATIVLILLLLAFYGRSFAVLCTTVAWYFVPMLSTKISPAQKTTEAILSRKIAPAQKTNKGK